MFGLTLGIVVETGVTVLLALTLGYCVILNRRLKRLHDDRDSLKLMVADLINATNLANSAIKELKATAIEADTVLNARLEEAERFGIELANHVAAGTSLMERIAKITSVARSSIQLEQPEEPSRVQSALQQLASRPRIRGQAA
jgi:hypothetical protein